MTQPRKYNNSLEYICSNLINTLVTNSIDELEKTAKKSFRDIGLFLEAEKGYLFIEENGNPGVLKCNYKWKKKEEATNLTESIRIEEIPGLIHTLKSYGRK